MMKNKKNIKKIFLVISVSVSVLFLSLICFITFIYHKYDLNIDKLTSLNNGIKVYSATGSDNTLYNTNRSIVDISELPEYVKNAFIDIEDKRFYSHNGFDLKRIVKSALVNLNTKSKSQGASTISQQLIKNALLSNKKTYSRKIEEVVLSIKMEKMFSKSEILQMYLNTIYFGSNAYGIENASRIYFNKSAKDLTLNEACCLAGLIKSPGTYSPLTNYENAVERKNVVAKSMLSNNSISKEEYFDVKNQDIQLHKSKENNNYEKEAIFEACRLLNLTERDLINKNYQIITFKHDTLQNQVQEINSQIINNAEQSTNSSLDSLSVVCNTNGHVLAYYANSCFNLHNLSRQPASTLKPLAVYLPCFEHNVLSPASVILDEEINYAGFSPKNADHTYHGYVTVRNALSNSLNIPAVKALDYLGVKKSKEMLSLLGINISNSDLNLSLSLGSLKNGVNVLDLLAAYNTIASKGNYSTLCFVNKILDEHGNVIYSHENYSTPVVSDESCFLLTDILKDCAKTGTANKLASLNLPIASKTGTASVDGKNTDLYNISYSTEHTMLTWIADIDDKTLPQTMLSSSQPTEINKQICSYLYSNRKLNDFEKPSGVEKVGYDIVELENQQVLVQPNHNIERYIVYDYFKSDNTPKFSANDDSLDLSVEINKYGATLSFQAKRNIEYNIHKQTTKGLTNLDTIRDKNGTIIINDSDVFNFDTIEYYITNQNDEIISDIKKIKPKDYLISLFNNEMLTSKKKWMVNITPL